MPMDSAAMAAQITTALDALTDEDRADPVTAWTAICGALIGHIQTHATIAALGVDLEPTDGSPDGETISTTGAIE